MTKRSTTTRDRHRALIRRDEPPCHLCGGPIDYSLPHLDPGAFVVDHVIPLARGGEDALHNKKAAHRQPSLQPNQERSLDRGHAEANSSRVTDDDEDVDRVKGWGGDSGPLALRLSGIGGDVCTEPKRSPLRRHL